MIINKISLQCTKRRRRRRQIHSRANAANEEDPKRDRATPEEEEEEVQMGPLSAREQIIYTVKCFVLSVLPLPSSVRPAGPWLDRYTRSGIFPCHSTKPVIDSLLSIR